MQRTSVKGRSLIERWEELVLYVYDDKVPKRHIDGKLQYPEWDGGPVRGTLTIGYGHTDAAGFPKITQGMRITKERADEILGDDLSDCEKDVRRTVKVPLSQHQWDALVSFDFNCGAGNLKKLCVLLNQGNYDDIPRRMMHYVTSKGERMQGLVNRRNAEVALWNTPDDPSEQEIHEIFSPKAEENDPPKSMAASKTGNSSIVVGGSGIALAASAVKEAVQPINDAVDNAKDLGIWGHLTGLLHEPRALAVMAAVIVLLAIFIWYDRRKKLTQELV